MNKIRRIALSSTLLLTMSPLSALAQQSGVFPGLSTPLQQQIGNFVAVPLAGANDPTVAQSELRFGLPTFFQPSVPTDVTGIGGSLGRAQGLRERLLGPDRNTLPSSHGYIVARDPRYDFTGNWLPVPATGVAVLPGVHTFAAVVEPVAIHTVPSTNALIMPSCNAQYNAVSTNHLHLAYGAIMVKTLNAPLIVTSSICGTGASVKIDAGALAMVSILNGKLSVFNLADSSRDSTVLSINDPSAGNLALAPIRIGHMIEIFPGTPGGSENELVAHTVLNRTMLGNGLTAETLRISYPRAMKRFNITRALPENDLQRVLKSAAAVSYVDREREWNDVTPYAR